MYFKNIQSSFQQTIKSSKVKKIKAIYLSVFIKIFILQPLFRIYTSNLTLLKLI